MKKKRRATDPSDRRAQAAGSSLAKSLLARRRAALARRRKVTRSVRVAARAPVTVPRADLLRAAGGAASRGTLVAEGDSWFDYPWTDILGCLEDDHGFDVDSVAHRGDRVEDMAYSGGQLEDLVRTIERLLRRNVPPKAILLSGGGNDVAGDEFAILLNHSDSPNRGFNASIVSGIVDERIRACYVAILSAVTDVCKARLGSTIPILVHGYDYAVPDGRGFLGGWWLLPGPWLEPGFRLKGYGDLPERLELVTQLIDRFNGMLKDATSLPAFSHVHHVDLRGTLPNGRDYKKWWDNELHPTKRGFRKVTERFVRVLDTVAP